MLVLSFKFVKCFQLIMIFIFFEFMRKFSTDNNTFKKNIFFLKNSHFSISICKFAFFNFLIRHVHERCVLVWTCCIWKYRSNKFDKNYSKSWTINRSCNVVNLSNHSLIRKTILCICTNSWRWRMWSIFRFSHLFVIYWKSIWYLIWWDICNFAF